MREILFRGAQKVDGSKSLYWYEGSLVIEPDSYTGEKEYYIQNESGSYLIIPETVGQYTGMSALWTAYENEPQEADVYEHDILQVFYENENILAKVEFEKGMFVLVSNQFSDGYMPLSDFAEYDGDDYYIDAVHYGNIHDNPELLEVKE